MQSSYTIVLPRLLLCIIVISTNSILIRIRNDSQNKLCTNFDENRENIDKDCNNCNIFQQSVKWNFISFCKTIYSAFIQCRIDTVRFNYLIKITGRIVWGWRVRARLMERDSGIPIVVVCGTTVTARTPSFSLYNSIDNPFAYIIAVRCRMLVKESWFEIARHPRDTTFQRLFLWIFLLSSHQFPFRTVCYTRLDRMCQSCVWPRSSIKERKEREKKKKEIAQTR